MSKSIDRVLQPDGSYKWEEVEHITEAQQIAAACPAPEPVVQPVKKRIIRSTKGNYC